MARSRFITSLKRRWLASRDRRIAGFTLIELLVAMLIGAIITVLLLGLVVELTEANQKDTARNETQRDMQAALNYITQDLREATYVYDGTCFDQQGTATTSTFANFCPGLKNHIPASLSDATTTPVLAFWRADPLPGGLQTVCNNATAAQLNDRYDSTIGAILNSKIFTGVPCLSGRSYTLVVYAIKQRDPSDTIWKGRARLLRYQLPQFLSNATTRDNVTTGYVPPLQSTTGKFLQWPYEIDDATNTPVNLQGSNRPTSSPDVLVDFVDDVGPTNPACVDPNNPGSVDRIRISPLTSGVRGFYACVRGQLYYPAGTTPPAGEEGTNQEIQLVLTGNVAGRSGFPIDLPRDESRLFPLQTRVLTRGIIDKNPQ